MEEESNLTKLKQGLKTVLGLSAGQGVSKEFKGISEFKEELGTLSSIVARRRGKEKEIKGVKRRRIEIGKRILLREKLRKELEEIEEIEEVDVKIERYTTNKK